MNDPQKLATIAELRQQNTRLLAALRFAELTAECSTTREAITAAIRGDWDAWRKLTKREI